LPVELLGDHPVAPTVAARAASVCEEDDAGRAVGDDEVAVEGSVADRHPNLSRGRHDPSRD
jgi:hypothetical protein